MSRRLPILLILPLVFCGMSGCAQHRSTLLPATYPAKQPPVYRGSYRNPSPNGVRPQQEFSPIQQVSANVPIDENIVVPPERRVSADQQIMGNVSPIFSEGQPFIPQTTASPANVKRQKLQRPPAQSALLQALGNEYKPLTNRNWIPNHARQATAQRNGDFVTITNIRNTHYRTATDYTTSYFDATYPLAGLTSVDLIEVPFKGLPSVAHVEVSFGFADGRHLGVSVEARYEIGESYDPLGGLCNQFELIYVIADERDMIRMNTDINRNDVYLYRLNLTQQEVQAMFLEVMNRANKLSTQPEFYHTVTNNCTTNIIEHINSVKPKAIPREYRTLFPGYLDHLLYDVKLITTESSTFKEARNLAKINTLAGEYGNTEYFSAGIRQNLFY
ncbi:MAG: DUF4105 domain-containing protein [Planctomycetaceae bacterium]|nr:DUF4105 domain-containing protein [Planctomycetaceae bacterium]